VKKNKMELIVGRTILIAAIILDCRRIMAQGAMVTGKMVEYTVFIPNYRDVKSWRPVMVNE